MHIDDNFPFLLTIGNNVTITGVTILCHDASPLIFAQNILIGPVRIFDNCFIGYGSILLRSIKICPNSIVGAGSVCSKDIEPGVVAAGSPAITISIVDDFIKRNKDKLNWNET